MTYQTSYPNKTTREYRREDQLVAVAINPTWKHHDADRHMDSQTQYFCLPGIWEADNQTIIVSPEKLQHIAEGK